MFIIIIHLFIALLITLIFTYVHLKYMFIAGYIIRILVQHFFLSLNPYRKLE